MAVNFSSSSEDVINRKIKSTSVKLQLDTRKVFEIDRCIDWIRGNGFDRVALQFPDDLLPYSVDVVKQIEREISATKLYILADTSFGSCCIDEVAAEHANCEAVIHFGSSCLSAPSRLKALIILGVQSVDWEPLFKSLEAIGSDDVLVVFSTKYSSHIETLQNRFPPSYTIGRPLLPGAEVPDEQQVILRRTFKASKKLTEHSVLWIGGEDRSMTNLVLTFNSSQIWSYNPETTKLQREGLDVTRSLMRRYYLVEKAKDSKIIGILVGTLGVKNYLGIIKHLRSLIRAAGRKCYTLAVGKLNVAKLANFPEIDIYVYVACPENSFFDSRDFYRPVITPYELEVAINPNRKWGQGYSTDFDDVLPGGSAYVPLPDDMGSSIYDTSLITGRIRTLGCDDEEAAEGNECTALVQKQGTIAVLHSGGAGEALSQRSWRGLDPEGGDGAAANLKKGRSGIAMAYKEEG